MLLLNQAHHSAGYVSVIMGVHSARRWDQRLYRQPVFRPLAWLLERTISTSATHCALFRFGNQTVPPPSACTRSAGSGFSRWCRRHLGWRLLMDQVIRHDAHQISAGLRLIDGPAQRLMAAHNNQVKQRGQVG